MTRPLRILIVDDNEGMARVTIKIIKMHHDRHIWSFTRSAEEAIGVLQGLAPRRCSEVCGPTHYDLILCDYRMPGERNGDAVFTATNNMGLLAEMHFCIFTLEPHVVQREHPEILERITLLDKTHLFNKLNALLDQLSN